MQLPALFHSASPNLPTNLAMGLAQLDTITSPWMLHPNPLTSANPLQLSLPGPPTGQGHEGVKEHLSKEGAGGGRRGWEGWGKKGTETPAMILGNGLRARKVGGSLQQPQTLCGLLLLLPPHILTRRTERHFSSLLVAEMG